VIRSVASAVLGRADHALCRSSDLAGGVVVLTDSMRKKSYNVDYAESSNYVSLFSMKYNNTSLPKMHFSAKIPDHWKTQTL